MTNIVYFSSLVMYCIVIVVGMMEWKNWSAGFHNTDGTFISKYYQIAFHIMRTSFVALLGTLGWMFYWLAGYIGLI